MSDELSHVKTIGEQRGLGRRLKRILPSTLFRRSTLVYNAILNRVPRALKYGIGSWLRRTKLPYSVIQQDSVVVQVGCPRDLLAAGRARTIHFARLAGCGTVVVIEPSVENCRALESFMRQSGLSDRIVLVEKGAWSCPGRLEFLDSVEHPASSVLAGLQEIEGFRSQPRECRKVTIEADTIDNILEDLKLPVPSLISVTTNGAELEILEGTLSTLQRGVPYISLARTGRDYPARMRELGYEWIARDDRGYTFQRAVCSVTES